jgi:hypothetical protein
MEADMAGLIEQVLASKDGVAIVAVVVMFGVVPLAAIAGSVWHEIVKTRSENELKQSMIERGLSVEEIERVMRAGTSAKWWPWRRRE